jgi:hypothetical protein
MRSTLSQVRQSDLPEAIGLCKTDVPHVAAKVNRAQQMLVNAGGETGWADGWRETLILGASCEHPYVTLPREFARIINVDVCGHPVRLQNEFFEYLPGGPGKFNRSQFEGFSRRRNWEGRLQGFERGTVCVNIDLNPVNQFLFVAVTDQRDVGSRILIGPAWDNNGNPIYSQDGLNPVNGFYMTFAAAGATSVSMVSKFTAVQKDPTFGDILLYQQDATTGDQVLLARYGPDELVPSYRRYYFHRLPNGCCHGPLPGNHCTNPQPPQAVTISALCKLEFIPALVDTDFLIIGNIPALIEECKAIRFSDQDAAQSAGFEAKCHNKAIKLLNDELRHYYGEVSLAWSFEPFGRARPVRSRL